MTTPVAWWGENGSGELVNTLGEVFEASPDDADNLPELAGPEGRSAEVWALYQTLQPVFARLEFDLERLEFGERGSWRARLHNGAEQTRIVSLTHGALMSLEDAAATLRVVADERPEADYEKAALVGKLRRDIARLVA